VYRASHNDRQFDITKADHIDPAKTKYNHYYHVYQEELTFNDVEQRFYEEHFASALAKRNARCIAQRHPNRVRTMEQYRLAPQSCPEETLWYIGNADDAVDARTLWQCVAEQIEWERKAYPNVMHLDLALHVDEEGAPHIHDRKVWAYHDDDGDLAVGQERALQEMSVPLSDPDKKPGKNNNRKKTHSRLCREHFAYICSTHGLSITLEPREKTKSGRQLEDYKAERAEERARNTRRAEERAEAHLAKLQDQINELSKQIADLNTKKVITQAERDKAARML
jgi:hypothetical protein